MMMARTSASLDTTRALSAIMDTPPIMMGSIPIMPMAAPIIIIFIMLFILPRPVNRETQPDHKHSCNERSLSSTLSPVPTGVAPSASTVTDTPSIASTSVEAGRTVLGGGGGDDVVVEVAEAAVSATSRQQHVHADAMGASVRTDNMRGVCLAACVVLGLTCGSASEASNSSEPARDWWDAGITVVQRSLQECDAARDVASCLKIKAVRALDRALHTGKGGKLKKMAGPAILIMVMAAYKLAMMMAGVAMLSGKALIVSKVALTLAGVAVLKKLLSHHDHEKTTVEIVKSPQVSHSHSYSNAHEGEEQNYHDKSWSVGPMAGGYSHRSMVDDAADAQQGGSPYLLPQDVASKRDYRAAVAAPATPMNGFVTGRGVETLSIRSHDPLRIVVNDVAEEDLRVHHRQRGLDMPILPGPASAALGFTEEPIDYSQFGEADRGAWRGLGSSFMPASDRSLRSAPSSEQQERAVDGAVNEEASNNYQPRSLGSLPAPAA
ncbi:hypothetical protein FOCC_FOCC000481 [Frankliniella occidentalis]|nr:hypothetical protein FOCC_FOCC000481 [Frankliniella occidentalis]